VIDRQEHDARTDHRAIADSDASARFEDALRAYEDAIADNDVLQIEHHLVADELRILSDPDARESQEPHPDRLEARLR